jgi:site-specific recombinase XerD
VLRDTFALTILEATEDVSLVAELLGHRQVETTIQRYLAAMDELESLPQMSGAGEG